MEANKHFNKAKEYIEQLGIDAGLNKYFSERGEKNDKRFSKNERIIRLLGKKVKRLETNHITHLEEKFKNLEDKINKLIR